MKIFKSVSFIIIFIFISLMFFENDIFFLKSLNLKLNLRAWKYQFPTLKLITLLFLFFSLGYFLSYYLNIKKNFRMKKEIKLLKKDLSIFDSKAIPKEIDTINKENEPDQITEESVTNKEEIKEN
ncbi:MAG: LapA family protein [Desulfobacterales bacterium]|nr:LapA family protein [Desulfobacterales bacterium]